MLSLYGSCILQLFLYILPFPIQGYSKFTDKRIQQYGRLFKTHIFGRPTIRIWGAENIRKVLMGEMDFVESSWPTSTTKLLGSQGLTQSQGDYHASMRRHIMAAFTGPALSGYIPLIRDPVQVRLIIHL